VEGLQVKISRAPFFALSMAFGFVVASAPARAQLPAVNYSNSVRTPGDIQYTPEGQKYRHMKRSELSPRSPAASGGDTGGGGSNGGGVVWRPTLPPVRPDLTLDPIAADEPVPPSGFPPIPDRLDLPISHAGRWAGGGGGGGVPAVGGGGDQVVVLDNKPRQIKPERHKWAVHYPPGAFVKKKTYELSNEQPSSPYPKVRTAPLPRKRTGDMFYSQGSPAYKGASEKDLKQLGREPQLSEREDVASQPEAPLPVVVNQAKTQDLSLPEDDFTYRSKQRSFARRMGKRTVNIMRRPVNMMGSYAGFRF